VVFVYVCLEVSVGLRYSGVFTLVGLVALALCGFFAVVGSVWFVGVAGVFLVCVYLVGCRGIDAETWPVSGDS